MRILLALDGSPSSVQARDLVAGLRWPPGTAIRLASAYEVPIDWTGGLGAGMAWVGDAEDALRDELTAELKRLAEPLAGHDWLVDWEVVKDRPATAIIEAARGFEADLIALGSRGRGPLTSMLLGSVSAEVVDHAACSVLVARGEHASRLLIATDGSDVARTIPELLGSWGAFRGVAAEVLSVAPLPERTFELVADVYTMGRYRFTDDDRHELLDRHRRFAEQLAQELAEHHIPATSSVVAGDAAHEIIDAARRRDADLIVTGTRGLHGLERVILGSVARNVLLHAPCSVIVIRGTSTAPGAGGKQSNSTAVPAP
jgi:nucleotide-binding universal stress UspA family protein